MKIFCLVFSLCINISLTSFAGLEYGNVCNATRKCKQSNMICNANEFCICDENFDVKIYYSKWGSKDVIAIKCEEKLKCSKYTSIDLFPHWCSRYCNILYDVCDCNGVLTSTDSSELFNKNEKYKGLLSHCERVVGFGQSCTLRVCDASLGLDCVGSRCLCRKETVYDFDMEKCIPKQSYMDQYNLTEYKVRYGHYCNSDDDCLFGLECKHNFKCDCSYPCIEYIREKDSCDCTEDFYESPILQIIIGIVLGLFSLIFWCACTCASIGDDDETVIVPDGEVETATVPDEVASLMPVNNELTQNDTLPQYSASAVPYPLPSYEEVTSTSYDKKTEVQENDCNVSFNGTVSNDQYQPLGFELIENQVRYDTTDENSPTKH